MSSSRSKAVEEKKEGTNVCWRNVYDRVTFVALDIYCNSQSVRACKWKWQKKNIQGGHKNFQLHQKLPKAIETIGKVEKPTTTANTGNANKKLMKMRYKVNFHVLLCFLSSLCSTTLAMMTVTMTTTTATTTIATKSQQTLITQSEITSKIHTNNDTQVANSTFLTNMNNINNNDSSNISTNSNSQNSRDGTIASQNHNVHLASSNDQSSSALVSNDENRLKFQTGKF